MPNKRVDLRVQPKARSDEGLSIFFEPNYALVK